MNIDLMTKRYRNISITARAAMWFLVCTTLQKSISFITVPIFTRLLPTEEYGLYSTFLSTYSVIMIFCTLNMHNCIYVNLITKVDNESEKYDITISLLSLSIVIVFASFICYLIFHESINRLLGLPTALMCLIFVQALFESPIQFWTMQQRFMYRYKRLVLRTISMTVLNAVLGVAFVIYAKQNQALARAFSIVLVYAVFGGWFYLYFFRRAKKAFKCKGWKYALNVQLPLLPHYLSLSVLSSFDRIMINSMVGSAQAGIYSVAYSAGIIVNLLKNSLLDAVKPWIYKKLKEKDYSSITNATRPLLILIALISFTFSAFAPEVIMLLAPLQYQDAIYIIPPVSISSFFTFLYNMFSIVEMYYEKSRHIMVASIIAALLNITLNFILIPFCGYMIAGYTTLLCYIALSFMHYMVMRRICCKETGRCYIYDIKFIVLLSSIVNGGVLLFIPLYRHSFARYLVTIIILAIVFVKRKALASSLKLMRAKNDINEKGAQL